MENITGVPNRSAPECRIWDSFHARKTAQFVEFDAFLSTCLHRGEIKPVHTAIGILFIIDQSFMSVVQGLLSIVAAGRYSTKFAGHSFHPAIDPVVLSSLGYAALENPRSGRVEVICKTAETRPQEAGRPRASPRWRPS